MKKIGWWAKHDQISGAKTTTVNKVFGDWRRGDGSALENSFLVWLLPKSSSLQCFFHCLPFLEVGFPFSFLTSFPPSQGFPVLPCFRLFLMPLTHAQLVFYFVPLTAWSNLDLNPYTVPALKCHRCTIRHVCANRELAAPAHRFAPACQHSLMKAGKSEYGTGSGIRWLGGIPGIFGWERQNGSWTGPGKGVGLVTAVHAKSYLPHTHTSGPCSLTRAAQICPSKIAGTDPCSLEEWGAGRQNPRGLDLQRAWTITNYIVQSKFISPQTDLWEMVRRLY